MTQNEKLLHIADTVCSFYGITTDSLYLRNRNASRVKARHLFIYLSKDRLGTSCGDLAVFLKQDTSNISKGFQSILEDLKHDKYLKQELEEIESML